ncbi:MAG: hypothetical protein WCG21_11845 [Eubacteriales bacterium]
MARIYSVNEDHTCDLGIDFVNGAAVVPDADAGLRAALAAKGYTVVAGKDALTILDRLTADQLDALSAYVGVNPAGKTKAAVVVEIETQLAAMKIEITAFTAIGNVSAGTVAVPLFANAAAVKAALPTHVLCNAGSVSVPVAAWVDTDTFNKAAAGSYTFTATLGALPAPYANTAAGTATVEVVVGA